MDSLNRETAKIPKRILNTLLSSLGAGVVPRSGAPYIAIGRREEIASLLAGLETVSAGGATVRFLIGRYGSGKSFLLQLMRGYALERGFLTADADLSPERRLCGGADYGLATYRELMRNLASRAAPDGGALSVILSRHYSALRTELAAAGILPESPEFEKQLRVKIYTTLSELEGGVGGFDFARVLGEYYSACIADDREKMSACLRWLRGEFSGKTEARRELGFSVSLVIDDDNWYDFIKLWALLATRLGYQGLILYIDECVNLYKIPNRISRDANYEKLLAIFNDTLQGRAAGLGVIFGGTPQFLEDTRRGLFSYEALRSRLADSRFTEQGYVTLSSPVIRLRRLSDDELLALIARLTHLHAEQVGGGDAVTPEEMVSFLQAALARAGAEELVTPREIIRDYLTLLNILHENPQVRFAELLGAEKSDKAASLDGEMAADNVSAEKQRPKFEPADLDF
ncbi:MAG: ATP-binding protein [Clostridia bacterium]|nr:ATP-binding protein [Clostridia bacterium]